MDGAVGDGEEHLRPKPGKQDQDDERHPGHPLDRADIQPRRGRFPSPGTDRAPTRPALPHRDPAEHDEQVDGGEQRADPADSHEHQEVWPVQYRSRIEGTEQGEHLTPESREAGQPKEATAANPRTPPIRGSRSQSPPPKSQAPRCAAGP